MPKFIHMPNSDLKEWIKSVDLRLENHLHEVLPKIAELKTDVKYLRKFFFIVATASIGGLIAGIINLLMQVK